MLAAASGGATGSNGTRLASAHSTSSESRRMVTSWARATQAGAVFSDATGTTMSARSQDSVPPR